MCLKSTQPIGYQIENEQGECFEHLSFEIIKDFQAAKQSFKEAICKEPNHQWSLKPIYTNTIEKPSFI